VAQNVLRADRPARAAVAPLPPFEALDRTHHQMLETLTQIDALIAHVAANGPDSVAQASAGAIHAFFAENARQHHADEERYVFPGLLAGTDLELVQHVRRLQQDHGWLEEDWLEIAPQIEAMARGYSWYDLDMLTHALPVFRQLYEDHIALEESLVYPAAKRLRPAAK
jgi:hemerythrin-like domain-containing protein